MSKEALTEHAEHLKEQVGLALSLQECKDVLQAYADECVEKNNEKWRKTLKDVGKLKQLEK